MNTVYLRALGVVAPGLPDWHSCRDVLRGDAHYRPAPVARFNPPALPANQRRRLTPTIRLAMQAATEAILTGAAEPAAVATVFATCNGDLDILDRICTALTLRERPVSPTDFHNSVHNAAAGYWTIGSRCHLPSTSLSAGTATFAAALLETVTQALCHEHPVMLVVYDQPPPVTLAHGDPGVPFAAALLVDQQQRTDCLGKIRVAPVREPRIRVLRNNALEMLLDSIPAAQALRLLELPALGMASTCTLPATGGSGLLVEYSPCR